MFGTTINVGQHVQSWHNMGPWILNYSGTQFGQFIRPKELQPKLIPLFVVAILTMSADPLASAISQFLRRQYCIRQWIERFLEIELPPNETLANVLKNGSVLCQIVNKLRPGSIPTVCPMVRFFFPRSQPLCQFHHTASTTASSVSNIILFNKVIGSIFNLRDQVCSHTL